MARELLIRIYRNELYWAADLPDGQGGYSRVRSEMVESETERNC